MAVHGANGIWGVLAVGIFANGRYGAGWNLTAGKLTDGFGVRGVLAQGDGYSMFSSLGVRQLAAQTIGALVICTVMFGTAYLFFKISDKLTKGGIRVSEEVDLEGLDVPVHGVQAYPEFAVRER